MFQLSDIIGYILTLFFGFVGGIGVDRIFITKVKNKKVIKQNIRQADNIAFGDITGGNINV